MQDIASHEHGGDWEGYALPLYAGWLRKISPPLKRIKRMNASLYN